MTLCASTSHYQVQLSVQIFHSRLSIWRLQIYLERGAQSFGVRCPNFTPSSFSIPRILPTSEIYSAFVAVWDSLCLYIARYHIQQVTSYHLLVLQEPRYSSIAQSLNIGEEHFLNQMLYSHHRNCATLTQPSLLNCNVRIQAVAFDVSSIHAASFKPLHPLNCTSVSLYSRRCIDAAAAQHPEEVMQKKPKDPQEGVTVRDPLMMCIEIWDRLR